MKFYSKLFFLFLLALVQSTIVQAQNNPDIKRTMHWFTGDGAQGAAGLDFTGGTVSIDNSSHGKFHEASYTMSDTCGNLLFYGGPDTVYSWNHQPMLNGGLYYYQYISAGTIAVPQPGNDSIFFIFYDALFSDVGQLPYAIVNMNHNNGLGEVVSKGNNLFSGENVVASECLGAAHHCNGRDIWVVGKIAEDTWTAWTDSTTNKLFAWLIDSTGINPPVVSTIAKLNLPGCMPYQENVNGAHIVFTTDGQFAAMSYMHPHPLYWRDSSYVEIYRFDNCTGQFSDPISFYFPCAYGVCFSPDNTKLYVAPDWDCAYPPETKMDTTFIVQYDISNYNPVAIEASKQYAFIDTAGDYAFGHIRLAPDGNIYVSDFNYSDTIWGIDKLGVITNPNGIGENCNYFPDNLYLNGREHFAALPNIVSSYYRSYDFVACHADNITEPEKEAQTISIFPNPAESILEIHGLSCSYNYQLSVFNSMGQRVMSKNLNCYETLNLSGLRDGLYTIRISYLNKNNLLLFNNFKIVKL